ncbi:MAG: prephenate dehydrogenase/arogenate dehydrogenase family protein [Bacteroidales bacterium]
MAINNILILGYGKMGQWFTTQLSKKYNIAVFEKNNLATYGNPEFHFLRNLQEIKNFNPDMVVNAVNLDATENAFNNILQYLPEETILADITSIKEEMKQFYTNAGFRFVSTHPMFGPTFADMEKLKNENAIIIEESDEEGKYFFQNFYSSFGLNIHIINFHKHDEVMAESLSLPFLITLLFSANSENNKMPGTTYQKHKEIAEGLLSEDNNLMTEILLNNHFQKQVKNIENTLRMYADAIQNRDAQILISHIENIKMNRSVPVNRKHPIPAKYH